MKKILFSLGLAALVATSAHAEPLKGQRIVGQYDCGTDICNFVTPDAGTFDFEVADGKVSKKIFKLCQIDDLCAITGNFDITNAVILKVTKVENSGKKYNE